MTILAAATAVLVPVRLFGASVIDTAISPSNASAGYRLLSSTEAEQSITGGSPSDTGGSYVADAGFEVRFTYSGDALTGSSDSTGVWLSLASTRTWTLEESGIGTKAGSGTIEIRVASTGTVIASASVTLDAEVEL